MKFADQIHSLIKRFSRNSEGVASIEFAIIVPVLAFGMLGMVDTALAIDSRMQMDSALRAAAESSLSDPGVEVVKKVFDSVKGTVTNDGYNENVSKVDASVNVTRYCACPDSINTVHSCNTICTGSKIPYLYYEMTGSGSYTGILLNNLTIERTIQVQLR
jgi:pilus assembly protein CpaE